MDELSITVTIADRPYHLTIDAENEDIIRKAAKTINHLVKEYAQTYAYSDNQDLVAMAALNYATIALGYNDQPEASVPTIEKKLSEIDQLLSNLLK
jgi:cell division protein ZapA